MNRITVVLLAALDALIVAAIGIGIALVPLTVMWAVQFQLGVDWSVFWQAAANTWLIGHGVNLTISLPQTVAAALGLSGASVPFQLTIAVLGFAVLAVLMGVRTGRRAAATPYRITGAVVAIVSYGILGGIVGLTARSAVVEPSTWQMFVLPAFVFGIGVLIGEGSVFTAMPRPGAGGAIVTALRAGTAAAGLVIAAAGILVGVLLVAQFGTVVGLYQQLQAGVLGATALTIGQLALLPNAVIWAASWLVGPGFAIGTGSSVGPIGTQLGPVPSIPLFGIVPAGDAALGFIGLLVPVLAGFAAGVLVRRRLAGRPAPLPSGGVLFLIALGAACVAGVELGVLSWWSAGAIGPGRLHDAGPNPWLVAVCAAAAVAPGVVVGILGASRRGSKAEPDTVHAGDMA